VITSIQWSIIPLTPSDQNYTQTWLLRKQIWSYSCVCVSHRVDAELDNGCVVETSNVTDLSHDETLHVGFLCSIVAISRSDLAVRSHLSADVKRDKERNEQWTDQTQKYLYDIINETHSLNRVLSHY